MLVIRLARTGRTKYPTYRLVAAESSRAATGKFVAILGHYNPHSKELIIKKDEIEKYLGNGAQPSNTVIKLLKQEKVKLPDWVNYAEKHKKPKKEVEEAPAAAPAADEGSEAPAAEETQAVAEVATEEAANKEEATPEAAPEDTSKGEAAQAEANTETVEAAGDAAIETAKEEAAE